MDAKEASIIFNAFRDRVPKDPRLIQLWKQAKNGGVTYAEANEFAKIVGGIMGETLAADAVRLSFDEALLLLNEPYKYAYSYISDYAGDVQNALNKAVNIGVKSVRPKMYAGTIEEYARKIAELENPTKAITEESERFALTPVDDTVRSNAEFHEQLGYKAMVVRTYEGKHREHTDHKHPDWVDCEWCQSLAGVYEYSEVKNRGNEVWKRHEGCRCEVSYTPSGRGSKAQSGYISGNSFQW